MESVVITLARDHHVIDCCNITHDYPIKITSTKCRVSNLQYLTILQKGEVVFCRPLLLVSCGNTEAIKFKRRYLLKSRHCPPLPRILVATPIVLRATVSRNNYYNL